MRIRVEISWVCTQSLVLSFLVASLQALAEALLPAGLMLDEVFEGIAAWTVPRLERRPDIQASRCPYFRIEVEKL